MLIFVLYLGLLFFVLAEIRVWLLLRGSLLARRNGRTDAGPRPRPAPDAAWPSVMVQLAVYREHGVLDRLLSWVVKMDYPTGRLAVQVLDDSEDQEAKLAEEIVSKYRNGGIRVDYLHRTQRRGYKSGALNEGLRRAECDLVALFDADCLPTPEFLRETVPLFQDAQLAAVHTRWSHLNDWESPLTMLQAAVLDVLFCFGNTIRLSADGSSLYLGTNGVWRKSAIDQLGGWREAPFTDEGLDLSCRAQMAGWSIAFVDEPLSSSEVPDKYLAYKSQQRRWARAALRVFLDYGRQPFKRHSGLRTKFMEVSLVHLVLSMPCVLLLGLATGLYVALGLPRSPWWLAAQIGLAASLVLFPPTLELFLSQKLLYRDWPRRGLMALRALPLAIGVSVSILAGFWDTVRDSKFEFVTTPKRGADAVIQGSRSRWLQNAGRVAAVEIGIGLLMLAALIAAVARGYPEAWLLLLSVSTAFLISGWTSAREIRQRAVASR